MVEKRITSSVKAAPIQAKQLREQIFYIKGVTVYGELFRPSDWVDRLCGIMASFCPKQAGAALAHQTAYSPFAQPAMLDDVRSVRVDPSIAQIDPKALDFLIHFARDNHLELVLAEKLNYAES